MKTVSFRIVAALLRFRRDTTCNVAGLDVSNPVLRNAKLTRLSGRTNGL